MSTDKTKKKSASQKGTVVKVLKRIKKYWLYLAISIVMAAVTVASTLYVPILVGRVVDNYSSFSMGYEYM